MDAVLSKYGLKTTGFAINVTSNNQSGNAQTAYSITNNYYTDPNYIPDSTNVSWNVSTLNGKLVLTISPKKGSWEKPLVGYDTSRTDPSYYIVYPMPSTANTTRVSLGTALAKFPINLIVCGDANSDIHPLHIYMKSVNDYYYFGDYNNTNKRWLYSNNSVHWIPERK